MRTDNSKRKTPLRRLTLALAAALCLACASFAMQVHRQALRGRPLAPANTDSQTTLIEKQMLDSRKHDPSRGISMQSVLPARRNALKKAGDAEVRR